VNEALEAYQVKNARKVKKGAAPSLAHLGILTSDQVSARIASELSQNPAEAALFDPLPFFFNSCFQRHKGILKSGNAVVQVRYQESIELLERDLRIARYFLNIIARRKSSKYFQSCLKSALDISGTMMSIEQQAQNWKTVTTKTSSFCSSGEVIASSHSVLLYNHAPNSTCILDIFAGDVDYPIDFLNRMSEQLLTVFAKLILVDNIVPCFFDTSFIRVVVHSLDDFRIAVDDLFMLQFHLAEDNKELIHSLVQASISAKPISNLVQTVDITMKPGFNNVEIIPSGNFTAFVNQVFKYILLDFPTLQALKVLSGAVDLAMKLNPDMNSCQFLADLMVLYNLN
jgi:hypothetical protein